MAFLTVRGLVKRFGGVVALDGVDLDIEPGEIHSIVGENGAGKSTFLKILAGIVKADGGTIALEEHDITNAPPTRLFQLGLSAAFQETSLFENLTVAENLFLGELYRQPSLAINWRATESEVARALTSFGAGHIRPGSLISELPAEQRQMVEILKAARGNARVISLDEPTASLTRESVKLLFDLLRRLRDRGVTVLYVSHHLNEVLELSDRITVLRDGKKVGAITRAEASESRMHEMMVGRAITYTRNVAVRGREGATPLLEVENLSDGRRVRRVSFAVYPGEVLGLAGLVGAGRSETAWAIMGLAPKTAGRVTYAGQDIGRISPQEAMRAGLCYLPEDRRQMGLFLMQGLPVNTTITRLDGLRRGLTLDFRKERSQTRRMLDAIGVKYASLTQNAINLSGGNQQKVLLGKTLFAQPRLLILDEPTKGIDVGSKQEIYTHIRSLTEQGMTVLLISSEVEEIVRLSHRVLVMGDGEIIGEFVGDDINESNITACYLRTQHVA